MRNFETRFMRTSDKKLIKKIIKYQENEIRKSLLEFDPLAIEEDIPKDEYDDLVHIIISILNRKDYKLDEKQELIEDRILEYSDLSIKDKSDGLKTVNRILNWWQSKV